MSMLVGACLVALVLLGGCSLVRPSPLAQNCGEWSQLNAGDQAVTAEALVEPSLMDRVRERQHLEPGASDEQVYLEVVSSITKTCDLQRRPELLLAEIVRDLYEAG